jgi:adenylosuccinate synthase
MDVPVVRRSLQISGCTEIVITKLDVLDGYEEVPVCTHYLKADGRPAHLMPFDILETERVVPQYEILTGWNASTTAARSMSDLPDEAINYLRRLEKHFGTRISLVSTGPDRDATMTFDSGR